MKEAKISNEINLKLHTVVLLVGPTNSGKSYFAKTQLIPWLRSAMINEGMVGIFESRRKEYMNIQYLSSDDLRREVLGQPDAHKYDPKMMHASEKAFKLLHAKLDMAMQYPNNAQFVVVDTTGLNGDFRDRIVKQAKDANYNIAVVIFDYKNGDEYLRHVDPKDQDKRILFNHLKKMRQDVWPTINRKDYDQIIKIRSKDFGDYPIKVTNVLDFETCCLDPKKQYDVIGDIHGCLNELKVLLTKRGYQVNADGLIVLPPGQGLVFVGDLIDKGPDSKGVIDFVHTQLWNPDIHVVLGNHENFVNKYLTGKLEDTGMPDEHRLKNFDCTETYKDDPDFIEKLTELVGVAKPFLMHPRFVVTHSPCNNKYIGKFNSLSLRKQNRGIQGMARLEGNKTLDELVKEVEEQLSFVKTEADRNAPLHIFGHVALKNVLLLKNKMGIDTGCAHGGRLTMASIDNRGGKTFFTSVPVMHESRRPEQLYDLWKGTQEGPMIDIKALEPREYGRVMWLARDKVSFISGTIAPAESDKETDNLESFQKALDYYRSKGVKEVVIQPKYMGSRCNLYLSLNREECFAVSRNGFKIKHIDLKPIFDKMMTDPKILTLFGAGTQVDLNKLVVLDGELMPWHAMGAGLIDEQYKVVEQGLQSEFEHLAANGFEVGLQQALADRELSGFQKDRNLIDKAALGAKYGQSKSGCYRALDNMDGTPLAVHADALKLYSDQIKIFGSPGPIEFKPFAILKVVKADGSETNWMANGSDNTLAFESVSYDAAATLDVTDSDACKMGEEFFKDITERYKMEGVVVKPRYVTADVAPALKVRSPLYLTLIYGYDYLFDDKYQRLIATKRTGRKMRTSMQEYDLGRRMLDCKQEEINDQNSAFLQLAARMIMEERTERQLDPRL